MLRAQPLGLRGLPGAGSPCTRCDTEALDCGFRCGGRTGCLGRRARCLSRAAGAEAAGAAGAFLAPGRLAPPAMPRPLTSGAALVGAASGATVSRCGRRGRGLLGAGALGAARDTETLRRCRRCGHRGLGLGWRSGPRLCGLRRRGGLALGVLILHDVGLLGGGGLDASGSLLGLLCRRALFGQHKGALVQRTQQQLSHVEHFGLLHVSGCGDVVDAVGDHHPAERAPGGDLRGAGVQRLLDAFVVDALADVLLHPHPGAAGAAAQAAVGVAGHLGELRAGGSDQLARRVVDLVVPAQVARVVVGDVLPRPRRLTGTSFLSRTSRFSSWVWCSTL